MLIHLKLHSLTLGWTGSLPEPMLVFRVWDCWRGPARTAVLICFQSWPFRVLPPPPGNGFRLGFEPQSAGRRPRLLRAGFCVVVPTRVPDGESRPSDCELISARVGVVVEVGVGVLFAQKTHPANSAPV